MKNTPACYGQQTGENTIAYLYVPAIYLPHIKITVTGKRDLPSWSSMPIIEKAINNIKLWDPYIKT